MINKLLAFTVLFLFIAIGCGDKKDEPAETTAEVHQFDSTDLKLEKIDDENGIYDLEYKFEKGDKFTYRFSSITNNEQAISTDTTLVTKLQQTISYIIDMDVNEIDENGVADIVIKIKSIKIDADVNGQKYYVKTDVAPDSSQKLQYAEHYAITESPFLVRVDKKGNLIEFSRIDRIVNKFLELREIADSVTADEKGMLRNSFTQSAIKPLTQQIFRVLPTEPVAKDSSWSIPQQPITLMFYQVQYENIYKVSEFEKLGDDRIAVLSAGVKSKITGDDKATESGVTYNFTKPKTIADGKIYFNIDKGVIQKSKTTTNINFSFSMEAMSPQGLQKGLRQDKNVNTNILELL